MFGCRPSARRKSRESNVMNGLGSAGAHFRSRELTISVGTSSGASGLS